MFLKLSMYDYNKNWERKKKKYVTTKNGEKIHIVILIWNAEKTSQDNNICRPLWLIVVKGRPHFAIKSYIHKYIPLCICNYVCLQRFNLNIVVAGIFFFCNL